MEPWNGLGWKGLPGSNPLPWAGTTSTRAGGSVPHPIWPWMLLGKSSLLTFALCWKMNPPQADQALLLLDTVLKQFSPNLTHCSAAITHLDIFSFSTNDKPGNKYPFLPTN